MSTLVSIGSHLSQVVDIGMDSILRPIETRPLSFTPPITLSVDGGPQLSTEQLAKEPLFTVSSITKRTATSSVPVPGPSTDAQRSHSLSLSTSVATAEDALGLLRCLPSSTQLGNILDYLTAPAEDGSMEIHSPTPTSSQIVKVLVDITIPNFWPVVSNVEKRKLVKCLRSVLGMRGIMARMSLLAAESTGGVATAVEVNKRGGCRELVEALALVMGKTTLLWEVWRTVFLSTKEGGLRGEILWKEFVGMMSGGKVLGVVAAATATMGVWGGEVGMQEESVTGTESKGEEVVGKRHNSKWVGDPSVYATWLGKGVVTMAEKLHEITQEKKEESDAFSELGWKCLRMLLWRAFGLGIASWDGIVEIITMSFLLSTPGLPRWDILSQLLCPSSLHDKSRYFTSLLRIMARSYLDRNPLQVSSHPWEFGTQNVSCVAGVIWGVSHLDPGFWNVLVEWLTGAGGVGDGIGIRRAAIAVLGLEGDRNMETKGGPRELKVLLEESLKNFGDALWIKHTPIHIQEANIQVILLCSGYIYRVAPISLKSVLQSSLYLNGITNRIATQSPRARFLGMVVGETLSELADEKGMKLDFHIEEMQSEEAVWWKGLVDIADKIGNVQDLNRVERTGWETRCDIETVKKRVITLSQVREGMDEDEYVVEVLEGRVEEAKEKRDDLSTSDEGDADQFKPYPKPDSDPEDSDGDDPVLNRKRVSPPVYVRDLLHFLRSHESYEHQVLALTHAASLIRRKAVFGTELTEHLHELATSLSGLQDKFEIPGFQDMKSHALISMVVAQPVGMGRWIARAFFEGDYSVSGRAVLLTALGIGARELGGLECSDMLPAPAEFGVSASKQPFPSKVLPGKLHDLYSNSPSKKHKTHVRGIRLGKDRSEAIAAIEATSYIDSIVSSLETVMIQPLAASAADSLSGPNVLKVHTFSSRMAIEAKRKKPEANKLSKIIGEAFFYPLTARWWAKLREFGPNAPQFNPHLLSHLLKTLALIVHAAGPAALALPQLTIELWDLVLSLRHKIATAQHIDSPVVLEATLFCLLTLVELNMDSGEAGKIRLVEQHSRELVETAEWVEGVFRASNGGIDGGIGVGGTGGEEERVRRLAAAVLLRIRECTEGYERRLVGEMGRWE